jgi:2-oxoglutarate dehydrogenase E2 component (dihydrolipoamide succinyltransferase)
MSIDIKVPAMGESVTEATVARWFKKEGDTVTRDEPLVELETDKVTVEVPSPSDGSIESISVQRAPPFRWARSWAIAQGAAKPASRETRSRSRCGACASETRDATPRRRPKRNPRP